ncbi:uncharacterized protein [Eurosta solidaginis]|uniref:uncharacterized protein isoform X2 n=1 Tax=Eurosta solidaginis TaxID=178769 RepID=UPI003530D8A4
MKEKCMRYTLSTILLLQITIFIWVTRILFTNYSNKTMERSLKMMATKYDVRIAPHHERSIIMVRHFLASIDGYIGLTHNIFGYTLEHPHSEHVTFPIYELFENLDNSQPWLRVYLLRSSNSESTTWQHHLNGFERTNQYFIGLELLHFIVSLQRTKLLALFRDRANDEYLRFATYDNFMLGNVTERFHIKELGIFTGNTENWLANYLGKKFVAFNVSDAEEQQRYEDRCPMLALCGWWGGANKFCKLPLSFRGSLELYIRPYDKEYKLMEV